MRKMVLRTAAATAIAAAAIGVGGGVASADTITTPEVPSHPTGADYYNAFVASGAHLGAGAAGLVGAVWAGAIPSIVQGALGSLSPQ
jgi:hypothetical protein